MKNAWRKVASVLFRILGSIAWIYTGGWLLLTGPAKSLVVALKLGELTIGKLISLMIEGFAYMSLAGGEWCVGYMLSNYFNKES